MLLGRLRAIRPPASTRTRAGQLQLQRASTERSSSGPARRTDTRAGITQSMGRCEDARSLHSTGRRSMVDVPPASDALPIVPPTAAIAAAASPPLPFAVVGSGPAAFYTSKYLLRELAHARVDMFERLPVPFGLVRFGVAPDHPDVKAVTNDFAQVANDSRFQYYGNVEVGRDVSVEELRQHYAGVILAYGAASERTLSIPGSDLKGIHPSRHFVNWYNGHPEHTSAEHDFALEKVRTAVIVGQGNVAIDCARVLLSPVSRLANTDISTHSLAQLASSSVQRCHMIGRRGAVQSAFSIGELRELATSVEGLRLVMDKEEFAQSENETSLREVADSRPKKRKHDLMRQILAGTLPSLVPHSTTTSTPPKDLHLRYFLTPLRFLPSLNDPSRVGAIVLSRTRLEGPPEKQQAVETGEEVVMETELVLTSIGYRSLPIPGIPFDARRHVVPNVSGRVAQVISSSPASPSTSSSTLAGLYVAGWLKRGPSGIIATNIMDARETVKSIVQDIKEGVVKEPEIGTPLPLLSPCSPHYASIVDRAGWSRIDAYEQARGLEQGKPRVKLVEKDKMMAVARVEKQ